MFVVVIYFAQEVLMYLLRRSCNQVSAIVCSWRYLYDCWWMLLQDESEDYVAHMWRRVALCSKGFREQLQAYQNAIEALNVSAVQPHTIMSSC